MLDLKNSANPIVEWYMYKVFRNLIDPLENRMFVQNTSNVVSTLTSTKDSDTNFTKILEDLS